MNKNQKSIKVVVVSCVAAIVLAACGGDGKNDGVAQPPVVELRHAESNVLQAVGACQGLMQQVCNAGK